MTFYLKVDEDEVRVCKIKEASYWHHPNQLIGFLDVIQPKMSEQYQIAQKILNLEERFRDICLPGDNQDYEDARHDVFETIRKQTSYVCLS